MDNLIIGYHKIRGLVAPLRMMCAYKEQKYTYVGYGDDYGDTWFGAKKPELFKQNSCINLPYIINGDDVVTQSNTCLFYLGQKLGIDTDADFIYNHTVIDQNYDLRNDLMRIVYPPPYGDVKTKEEFPEAAKAHIEGSVKGHLTKLEGFCKGPYMCGEAPRSGDFAVFEMLDQHQSICISIGVANVLDSFPKLKALHAKMKAEPTLAKYFASDCYVKWSQNGTSITHFTGQGPDFEGDGPTMEEVIEP
eukprot:gnl/MRDRNA2_/MRDRNA2_122913_c0_seq1.p1 gnl/MRDRNA2_/MRDRNA2_122913_c0~~gnl/MRDRNA2_/MRDRNA2_122913_c0_seq1.p1  ORF type:complete len:248 (-),score=46.14 gnl/MRDRNA2_/MRDRNA2_122913_c0_seq1:248-991(-)